MNRWILFSVSLLGIPLLIGAKYAAKTSASKQASATQIHTVAGPARAGIWKQSAQQLARNLRGKTREQVLYEMPIVSNKDRIVHSDKAAYALVEYFQDDNFRKLLFKADDPQIFITAAATAADVLAINKKYRINIGLTQDAFEQTYATKAQPENDKNLPDKTALYRLSYTDINTPKAQNHWFLFEQGILTKTFYTKAEKEAYLNTLQPAEPVSQKSANVPTPAPVRKALISGGTEWDKAYLPHVVNYKPTFTTPTLTQEK